MKGLQHSTSQAGSPLRLLILIVPTTNPRRLTDRPKRVAYVILSLLSFFRHSRTNLFELYSPNAGWRHYSVHYQDYFRSYQYIIFDSNGGRLSLYQQSQTRPSKSRDLTSVMISTGTGYLNDGGPRDIKILRRVCPEKLAALYFTCGAGSFLRRVSFIEIDSCRLPSAKRNQEHERVPSATNPASTKTEFQNSKTERPTVSTLLLGFVSTAYGV